MVRWGGREAKGEVKGVIISLSLIAIIEKIL